MLIPELMLPVLLAPRTTTMIPARSVYSLAAFVRLAVFLAMLDGFVKAHLSSPRPHRTNPVFYICRYKLP